MTGLVVVVYAPVSGELLLYRVRSGNEPPPPPTSLLDAVDGPAFKYWLFDDDDWCAFNALLLPLVPTASIAVDDVDVDGAAIMLAAAALPAAVKAFAFISEL